MIAFESDRSGDYDIWVVNSDGTGLRDVFPESFRDRSRTDLAFKLADTRFIGAAPRGEPARVRRSASESARRKQDLRNVRR